MERTMKRGAGKWLWVAAGLALVGAEAEAQHRREYREGRHATPHFGFAFIAADPVGDLAYYFDQGLGGQFEGSFPIEPTGHLRLRADLGFVIYGHERQYLCYSTPVGCRIGLDLTTTNSIFFGGVGPELVLATGAIAPYVNASAGFSYFATISSLGGDDSYDDFAHTTNYSDAVFAWRAGGGIRVRVKGGRTPIHLDFGVERHENGVADFLTEGDIIDHPDGSITMYPNRSEADFVAFRFGMTFGLGGHRRGR
jgi:hypothetical protein